MNVLIKFVQYFIQFCLTVFLAEFVIEQLKILSVIVHLTILYFNLKWMSRYPISFAGMKFINGSLSLMSMVFIFKIINSITGTTSYDTLEGTIIMIACLLPIIFWWNFNIIAWFRDRSENG